MSLQDVAIEGNEIPDNAFKGNETLKTFYFPKNITRIGEYAFRGCKNLAGDLYIPYTVEEVDDYAFEECSGLKGNLAFAGTGYPIGVSKLKRIGVAAFNKCKFNGTLTFGVLSELQEIDNYAFHSCKGFIGGLDIPDNVTRIGSYAFYSAFGFTHISLGKKVSSIGVFGFNVEGTCKLIYSHNPVPPTLAAASSLPLLSSSEQTRLIIPSGTTSAYKNAQYWKDRVFDLYLDSL